MILSFWYEDLLLELLKQGKEDWKLKKVNRKLPLRRMTDLDLQSSAQIFAG